MLTKICRHLATISDNNTLPRSQAAGHRAAEYGVVIDAGSSGNRVYVYTWSQRSHPDELPTDVQQVYNYKVHIPR